MDKLYYDAHKCIFQWLDIHSLVHLLNCNNKKIYYALIKYIKEKKIHKDILRYDFIRFQNNHQSSSTSLTSTRDIFTKGCSLEVFKHLLIPCINIFCMDWYIAHSGNLLNLQYLREQNVYFNGHTLLAAVRSQNLEMIRWLVEIGCPFSARITCAAALQGNIENLKWLVEKGCTLINDILYDESHDVMGNAANYGSISNMEWLKEKGCPLTKRTFAFAAEGNIISYPVKSISLVDIKILQWLKENLCPWDEITFANAAKNGNLDNMKWLKENNCPWDEETFSSAAENGNLDNMKWLLNSHCPWSSFTFACAADYSTLENMKWLKDNGCPYDEWSWVTVTRSDDCVEKIIEKCEYLKSIHCPWNRLTFEHESDPSFDIRIRQWLISNGYEYNMW